MKPDGVTMETMEPTEAAAGAEPSLSQGAATQDEVTEQTPSPSQPEETADTAAPPAAQEANGKPAAADSKAKPKALVSKTKPAAKTTGASGHNSRPGTVLNRAVNGVKPTTNAPAKAAPVKKTTTTTGASATGAVPKRAVPPSTARTQTKVPDKKPVGPARTTAAAAMVTNGTKPASTTLKKPPTRPVNGSRPKTTAPASRPAASTASKPSTSTTAKADTTAKTTRPTTAPSTSRPASTTSRPTTAGARPTTTATIKPSTTGTGKPAAFRATAAPSAGRTTAAQPLKNTAAAKKDVSRPASATATKKPTPATTLGATKKPEPSKPTATAKPESKKPVPTNAADLKQTRPRTQEPQKSAPTKKATSPAARFPGVNKLPQGRNPPFSPANKPAASPAPAKRVPKPTQAVPPFTAAKKPGVKNSTNTARAPSSAAATAAAATAAVAAAVATAAVIVTEPTNLPAETQVEDEVALPEGSSCAASAQEEVPSLALAQDTPSEVVPQEAALGNAAAPSLPQSPVTAACPPTSAPYDLVESTAPSLTTEEQISVSVEAALPPMGEEAPPELSEEPVHLMLDQTLPISPSKPSPPAANGAHQVVSPSNLNEEEDEEEREGSQQVSVSEMSGTTQPTEESRPGSAGPVGGSAWRAGGALFSELDSEEVSGSQQGASELSAPGVLEGTESMDDLGDASLKGAIDMEGASAGSPDFEKVPDIPVNDFEEDEDDYDDRVCDMDVGSERADDLRRPRYDNEVDEEEDDEDVDMASEGVTESGLESYGNADEDDFAEDERLDNLNRVAQPPPPPLLPSAPAAQWDQPNPFADPWAQSLQPLQPQQPLEHVSQPLQAAAVVPASPSTDLWQADSETPTQSPAQPWLELGCASFVAQNQEVSCHSSVQGEASKPEAQSCMDQSSLAPLQTLAPAPLSATGMSLSSTLSSDTSTPEELCDYNREGKLQIDTPVLSLQPNPVDEDLGIHLEGEDGESEKEAEAETLPADEVLGGPATAPTSNPSSSSTTEDEASDTEGEAQLEDSLDTQGLQNITFECQPPAQRCLSALEEGEEEDVEGGVREDSTPPSANSAASYGFDTSTTASNSNAPSTGESCTKSPGIFSLEELPEEAKEPCLLEEPPTQPCPAEQHYMQCGKQEAEPAEDAGVEVSGSEEAPHAPSSTLTTREQREDDSDDPQPPYYAICEKTENSFAGFGTLWHAHRRDHPSYPRPYCDVIKPHCGATVVPPRLSCADLPPRRSPGQQALSPQLRKLEQHQRQLLEMQQRREQQSRPMEEVEQERKSRAEEEQRKKREEAEEEIKKNKEEEQRKVREHAEEMKREEENRRKEEVKHREQQRRDLQLQLQQQQQELKQRQQIMQWQKELEEQQSTVLLSPSSGLCTIYEALENSDEEEEEGMKEVDSVTEHEEAGEEALSQVMDDHQEQVTSDSDKDRDSSSSTLSPPPLPDSPQRLAHPQHPDVDSPPRDDDDSSTPPMESPERPPPLDLDWGKKVDIVQQLINQTLLLTGDGCSSLLLLPGGGGGTLSPLESSLWPSLLPPLTPPSATVTSVSSFSPEAPGSSPQGEWTVVELETHH